MSIEARIEQIFDQVVRRNPGDREFHQAVGEVLDALGPVLEKHPEHLRGWLYLAETELKDGNAKDAKTAIDKVTGGTDGYDPPEARRIKKWAKAVGEAIDAELK